MKKSLISLAALAACAALSSTAFAASTARPAVVDTGQVPDATVKAVEFKPVRVIALNSTSAVVKAMVTQMQLVSGTKTLADVDAGAHANLRELTPAA